MTIINTPTRTLRGRTLRPLYHYARLVERATGRKPIKHALVFDGANGKTSIELHYIDGSIGFTSFAKREAAERWLEVFLKDRTTAPKRPQQKVFDYSTYERF